MKLDEIFDEWDKDCTIDRTDLGYEAARVPKLHSKYYRMYSDHRMSLKKSEIELKELTVLKFQYYTGTLDDSTRQERGWEPFYLKILRSDVDRYIDADKDITAIYKRIAVQKEKVDALESIVKGLSNRGYLIRTALDHEKFIQGA